MTDDPSTAIQPPAEIPLGIQQPLLSPIPLGQTMLQPKFFTPLGARSLRVLDPSIFLAVPDLAASNQDSFEQESSFQNPFFDAPNSSTSPQPTAPVVQTKPQPRSRTPASAETNFSPVDRFEAITETPITETPTTETPIVETPTVDPIAAEDSLISPPTELNTAIAPVAPEVMTSPEVPLSNSEAVSNREAESSEVQPPASNSEKASDQISEIGNLGDKYISPGLVSRLPTEVPAEDFSELSIPNVEDSISSLEPAIHQPDLSSFERSPAFSSDSDIIPTSIAQPTNSATIQRLANSEASSLEIGSIAEEPVISAMPDLSDPEMNSEAESDANLAGVVQPVSELSNLLDLPDLSDSAIAQTTIDLSDDTIARLPVNESIEPAIDIAESPVQSAFDQALSENQENVVDASFPPKSIAEETIQRSPSEPTVAESALPDLDSDKPVSAIASHPANSPNITEVIQPETIDLQPLSDEYATPVTSISPLNPPIFGDFNSAPSQNRDESGAKADASEDELKNQELENPEKISFEPVNFEADIDSCAIAPIQDQTAIQPKVEANLADPSDSQHQPDYPETHPLQDLEPERTSQPIDLDASVSTFQAAINPQLESVNHLDPIAQSNTELNQPKVELKTDPIAAETPTSEIQPEMMTQAEADPTSDSFSPESIESTPAKSDDQVADSSDSSDSSISDRSIEIQPLSIQPISTSSQPIQRKAFEAEDVVSDIRTTSENEDPVEIYRDSSLPPLPSVIQRLSILQAIASTPSLYPAPDWTVSDLTIPESPAMQPGSVTRSSVIPEIQAQPFEPLFDVPFQAPDGMRKGNFAAIAPISESPTPTSSTPEAFTQESPVTTEWNSIAELFQPSENLDSTGEPEVAFDDDYPQLLDSNNSAPNEIIQTSPVEIPEPSTPVEPEPHATEQHGDRKTSNPSASSSPEHLERLAQEIYQLIRQRLALERERSGKSGSGRLL
jgi:hypothetical protein